MAGGLSVTLNLIGSCGSRGEFCHTTGLRRRAGARITVTVDLNASQYTENLPI